MRSSEQPIRLMNMFMNYGIKKSKPGEAQRKKKRNAVPRFYRVPVTIRRERGGAVTVGRIMLSDLAIGGVGIFLPEPIAKDERVTIVIEHPHAIYIKGEIAWCTLYNMNSRVLSAESLGYRAYVKFRFDSTEEREALRNFVL